MALAPGSIYMAFTAAFYSVDTASRYCSFALQAIYAPHRAQTYYRAFGIGTYDNLLKLRYRRQTPCVVIGTVTSSPFLQAAVRSTPAADLSSGPESFLKVGDSDAKVGHLVGLDPYLHRIISSSDIAYASNARGDGV